MNTVPKPCEFPAWAEPRVFPSLFVPAIPRPRASSLYTIQSSKLTYSIRLLLASEILNCSAWPHTNFSNVLIFWVLLLLCLILSSPVSRLFSLKPVSVKLFWQNCHLPHPVSSSFSLPAWLLSSLSLLSVLMRVGHIPDSFCQIFLWFVTLPP